MKVTVIDNASGRYPLIYLRGRLLSLDQYVYQDVEVRAALFGGSGTYKPESISFVFDIGKYLYEDLTIVYATKRYEYKITKTVTVGDKLYLGPERPDVTPVF
jgi:hypothetical protein